MKKPKFQFISLIRRFVYPYKWYVALNILCNILSTVFSLFSFALIIPILEILFKTTTVQYTYMPFAWDMSVIKNNAYCWIANYIEINGAMNTLFLLGAFLVILTFFKTGIAYLASYFIIPMRTGLVRDMRNQLYDKIVDLNLGFLIKRISNHSITSYYFSRST